MIIRNKETGETIEVMDNSLIAESAWEVVKKKEKKKTSKHEDSESEAEDSGKNKKK